MLEIYPLILMDKTQQHKEERKNTYLHKQLHVMNNPSDMMRMGTIHIKG